MWRRTTRTRVPLLLLLLLLPLRLRVSVRALKFLPPSIETTETTVYAILVDANATVNCSLYLLNATSDGTALYCQNTREAGSWIIDLTSLPLVVLRRLQLDLGQAAVEEALAVVCCQDGLNTSLLVQAFIWPMTARINANISLVTSLPNPAYVPLSLCPCDLTLNACDIGCCCDNNCKSENGSLLSSCLPGVFGGLVSLPFEHQCSEQQARNSPDWFPFLCVQSPAANSPTLGLFHPDTPVLMNDAPLTEWDQIPPSPSFVKEGTSQTNVAGLSIQQGSSKCLQQNTSLTLPQATLGGECIWSAPVAFLKDTTSRCVVNAPMELCRNDSLLSYQAYYDNAIVTSVKCFLADPDAEFVSAPGSPRLVNINNGLEGPKPRYQPPEIDCMPPNDSNGSCSYVVVSLTYEVTWKECAVQKVQAFITLANVSLSNDALLTQKFSVQFINPFNNSVIKPRSGNPGYLVGKPLLTATNSTGILNLTEGLYLLDPVGFSLCNKAQKTQVKFGENSMSGCLFRLGLRELNENCSNIRDYVLQMWTSFVPAMFVGRRGNSNPEYPLEWVTIENNIEKNKSATNQRPGMCADVPAHLHIRVLTAVMGNVEREPQMEILAVQINVNVTTWQLLCGGTEGAACNNRSELVQSFPVTSSVQFIHVPAILPSPQTRFQLNYTEFDCSRNDVCWPELALPFVTTYKGHPNGYAMAQGMILVLLFVLAGLLAAPWHAILT